MNIQKLVRYWFTLFIVSFLCMRVAYANEIVAEEGECYAKNLPQAGLPAIFPNILKFTWKTDIQGDITRIQWHINDNQIENTVTSNKNDRQPNNLLYDSKGQFIGISGQEFRLNENNYVSYRININRNLKPKKDEDRQDNNFFKFTFGVIEKKDGKPVVGGGSGFYNSQDSSCQIKTRSHLKPYTVQDYPSLVEFNDYALQYLAVRGAKYVVNEVSTCYVRIPDQMDKYFGCGIKKWLEVKTEVGYVGMSQIAKIGVNNLFDEVSLKKATGLFNNHETLTDFAGNLHTTKGVDVTYKAQEENQLPGYVFYFFDKNTKELVQALKFCEIVLNYNTPDEMQVYPEDEVGEAFKTHQSSFKQLGCENIDRHKLETHN